MFGITLTNKRQRGSFEKFSQYRLILIFHLRCRNVFVRWTKKQVQSGTLPQENEMQKCKWLILQNSKNSRSVCILWLQELMFKHFRRFVHLHKTTHDTQSPSASGRHQKLRLCEKMDYNGGHRHYVSYSTTLFRLYFKWISLQVRIVSCKDRLMRRPVCSAKLT